MSPIVFTDLLVRPALSLGESHNGYKLRLTHVNGLTSPGWLDNCTNLAIHENRRSSHTRWCPLCLSQEAPIWLEQWSGPIPTCQVHQCWLVDTCEKCKRPLSWRSARFLSCSCGGSLFTITSVLLGSDVSEVISASTKDSSVWWADLNIEHRWRVANLLGALHKFGLNNKPLKKASVNSIENLQRVIGTGVAIMHGGEVAFHDLLCRIRVAPSPAQSAQLMRDAFPTLLTTIRRQLPMAAQEVLFRWVRTFLLGTANNESAISWKASRVTLSAIDCAKRLRIRPDRVLEKLSSHGVSPPSRVTSTGRTMLIVAPSVIANIQSESIRKNTHITASKLYGLSIARIQCLIKADLIKGDAKHVDSQSIADLLRAAARTATSDLSDVQLAPLDSLLRTAVPLPRTAEFFSALIAGKIRNTCNPRNANEILVCRQDTKAALINCTKSVDEFVSIPQAAERLKLKQEVLYHLVNRRLIKVTSARVGRRAARFISELEIARFTEQVEPLSIAAQRCGISKQSALRWAISCNLKIISGPSIDGGRQYFLRKVTC